MGLIPPSRIEAREPMCIFIDSHMQGNDRRIADIRCPDLHFVPFKNRTCRYRGRKVG